MKIEQHKLLNKFYCNMHSQGRKSTFCHRMKKRESGEKKANSENGRKMLSVKYEICKSIKKKCFCCEKKEEVWCIIDSMCQKFERITNFSIKFSFIRTHCDFVQQTCKV